MPPHHRFFLEGERRRHRRPLPCLCFAKVTVHTLNVWPRDLVASQLRKAPPHPGEQPRNGAWHSTSELVHLLRCSPLRLPRGLPGKCPWRRLGHTGLGGWGQAQDGGLRNWGQFLGPQCPPRRPLHGITVMVTHLALL